MFTGCCCFFLLFSSVWYWCIGVGANISGVVPFSSHLLMVNWGDFFRCCCWKECAHIWWLEPLVLSFTEMGRFMLLPKRRSFWNSYAHTNTSLRHNSAEIESSVCLGSYHAQLHIFQCEQIIIATNTFHIQIFLRATKFKKKNDEWKPRDWYNNKSSRGAKLLRVNASLYHLLMLKRYKLLKT